MIIFKMYGDNGMEDIGGLVKRASAALQNAGVDSTEIQNCREKWFKADYWETIITLVSSDLQKHGVKVVFTAERKKS